MWVVCLTCHLKKHVQTHPTSHKHEKPHLSILVHSCNAQDKHYPHIHKNIVKQKSFWIRYKKKVISDPLVDWLPGECKYWWWLCLWQWLYQTSQKQWRKYGAGLSVCPVIVFAVPFDDTSGAEITNFTFRLPVVLVMLFIRYCATHRERERSSICIQNICSSAQRRLMFNSKCN